MIEWLKSLFYSPVQEVTPELVKAEVVLPTSNISEPVYSLCECITKFPKKFKLDTTKSFSYGDTFSESKLTDRISKVVFTWTKDVIRFSRGLEVNIKSSFFTEDEITLITQTCATARLLRINEVTLWKEKRKQAKRDMLTTIYQEALKQ